MPEAALTEKELRYEFADLPSGIDESFGLKGEEPYGASKATADLYLPAYSLQYGPF